MSETSPSSQNAATVSADAKSAQVLGAALLGLMVLMAVGFAPVEVIHNATHDTRHSSGFPCH